MIIEEIAAKTLLSRVNYEAWFGADYTMNLYRGCCHGCIYCDSRSECYHVEDFDRVRVKSNAVRMLRRELSAKRTTGIIGLGAMSDSYNPFEQTLQTTRAALQEIAAAGFGISLDTKSALVKRDLDLFQRIRDHHSAIVKLTITTADDALSRLIEPHVCPSSERFAALRALADAGIFCGVLITPVLPFITDTEENIREIIRKTANAGGKFVFSMFGVTLRTNQRQYFFDQLDTRIPGMSVHYQHVFGNDYYCPSPHHQRLKTLVQKECRAAGLLWRMPDIIRGYRTTENAQLSLF